MQSKGNNTYSVIDLGTNTCLLLVARFVSGKLTPLYEAIESPRIGKGIYDTRIISDDAFVKVRQIFDEYRDISLDLGAGDIRAFGTSALREAGNRDDFISRIEEATGIRISVISGKVEAECAYTGATYDLPKGEYAVIDIGGGSTEISFMQDGELVCESSDIGSVRLTEKFFLNGHSNESLIAATEMVNRHLDLLHQLPADRQLVGVAGTLTTLSAIRRGLTYFVPELVHGDSIPFAEVAQITDKLSSMSDSERLSLGNFMKGRSDIITAGALILREYMKRLGTDAIKVSARGLRYGLLLRIVDFSKNN